VIVVERMTDQMTNQLVLGILLKDGYEFSRFSPGQNQEVVTGLKLLGQGKGEQFIYLWGGAGTGRTHLLQSVCHDAAKNGLACSYLPIEQLKEHGPKILDGLETQDVICIDDVEPLIGDAHWEECLFHLFNKIRDNQRRLLVAASKPPRQQECVLPDLHSRLSWGLTYQLKTLTDEEKISALQDSADRRGFHLSSEVAQFIFNRCSRDFSSLFYVLDRLDEQSLQQKRKLTIPFVKGVMSW